MTNVTCVGNQDRETTTSETHPTIPPPKTRNCYKTGDFDRDKCGTNDEKACVGKGGWIACKADDNYGGYCETHNGRLWVSDGPNWRKLTNQDLLNRSRTASAYSDDNIKVRRALRDQERRFTNRIRELQIMGKDPVKGPSKRKEEDNEVHGFVSDMLFNFGMAVSFIMFMIFAAVILIQYKTI